MIATVRCVYVLRYARVCVCRVVDTRVRDGATNADTKRLCGLPEINFRLRLKIVYEYRPYSVNLTCATTGDNDKKKKKNTARQ